MEMISQHRIACTAFVIMLVLLGFPLESLPDEDPALAAWSDFSGKPECTRLILWLRCKAKARLTGTSCDDRIDVAMPYYFGHLGMFVTLKKGNRVRGCYGAFSHSSADAGCVLSDYLIGALTRDPRYDPLDVSELADTRIIITITSQPFSVNEINSIDVHRFGIALQCGNDTAIYVPAEIKNTSYIEKRIQGAACQVSAFKAVTLQ